ncbi:MAG TPA: 23S rRNA (adenine(2503)-C(2))-methyltransferase RlmN [Thermotogae bacterium]|nr:rRNA (adenine2503-C2)-methyltransferase [Thermotogota bacterium]HCZ07130.1 23S rRNA (adenine(2503)-C(2))-methyltransferase RlmN [Thermotogota bacterium]
MSYEELVEKLTSLGMERYRADQIADWIYKKLVFDFTQMTNLPKTARNDLSQRFGIHRLELSEVQTSRDGTRKYLWKLFDGEYVESVSIPYSDRKAACISTQAGCPVKCSFCATGQSGFERNLNADEIVAQMLLMEFFEKEKFDNVVFMGMGEPLLNTDNVFKAIEILSHPKLRNMGLRRITVSTVGIPEGIEELARRYPQVRLSVSLHAPDNAVRDLIVPLNHRYPLEMVLDAVRRFQEITGKRVTFEYVLIRGINDSLEHARKLSEILKSFKAHVNLIPVNETGAGFQKPSRKQIQNFAQILESNGIETTVRAEKGADISAACGQLRAEKARR